MIRVLICFLSLPCTSKYEPYSKSAHENWTTAARTITISFKSILILVVIILDWVVLLSRMVHLFVERKETQQLRRTFVHTYNAPTFRRDYHYSTPPPTPPSGRDFLKIHWSFTWYCCVNWLAALHTFHHHNVKTFFVLTQYKHILWYYRSLYIHMLSESGRKSIAPAFSLYGQQYRNESCLVLAPATVAIDSWYCSMIYYITIHRWALTLFIARKEMVYQTVSHRQLACSARVKQDYNSQSAWRETPPLHYLPPC